MSISGTFLKFIDPILVSLGRPDAEDSNFDAAIKLGWTVWNAVVKNDVDGDPSFLESLTTQVPKPFSKFTNTLIERKRREFGEFSYLIGVCELRKKKDGSITLFADARETKGIKLQ